MSAMPHSVSADRSERVCILPESTDFPRRLILTHWGDFREHWNLTVLPPRTATSNKPLAFVGLYRDEAPCIKRPQMEVGYDWLLWMGTAGFPVSDADVAALREFGVEVKED